MCACLSVFSGSCFLGHVNVLRHFAMGEKNVFLIGKIQVVPHCLSPVLCVMNAAPVFLRSDLVVCCCVVQETGAV